MLVSAIQHESAIVYICRLPLDRHSPPSPISTPLGCHSGEGNGTPLQYSCLVNPMDGGAWWAAVHGVAKNRTRLSDFTFTFHFHAVEKEMATHSSVLAWKIPGTVEPDGLPSMGSHRVGHDWSDLVVVVGCHRAPDWALCVIQQCPTSYLFYSCSLFLMLAYNWMHSNIYYAVLFCIFLMTKYLEHCFLPILDI